MERALGEFRIEGVATTIPLHQRILREPAFRAGRISTNFLEENLLPIYRRQASAG
jgi:acetyl-CoA carboxylase biotin carboxylase subunit